MERCDTKCLFNLAFNDKMPCRLNIYQYIFPEADLIMVIGINPDDLVASQWSEMRLYTYIHVVELDLYYALKPTFTILETE